ncbi:hypothetical protein [Nocardiopsis ansamitocini]|uniref:Uncharacterized protein n=1 Tax=Nocardiopsis ansamitocini TaxID=1670832 RepID=A0A9W6PAI4_9ACTN|nr:hypothetical protein [Nocardiopsis ansamitocini]GLU50007.1 hypothetical protein Nans01_43580 [Nocardiopsis ansamitocini]
MAWSTRQPAEPAGATVEAVRHRHGTGLPDGPERSANDDKRSTTGHRVRLPRIRHPAVSDAERAQDRFAAS